MLTPFIPPHPTWCRDRDRSPLAACADVGLDGTVYALHHFGEVDGFGVMPGADGPAVCLGRTDMPGVTGAVRVFLDQVPHWRTEGMTATEARSLAAELLAAAGHASQQ